jgi:hypothetical protein
LSVTGNETAALLGEPGSVVSSVSSPADDDDDAAAKRGSGPFAIRGRAELGYMAELFFPRIGVTLFYVIAIIYLFGDLCICARCCISGVALLHRSYTPQTL